MSPFSRPRLHHLAILGSLFVLSDSSANIIVSESFSYTSTNNGTRLTANIGGLNGGTGFAAAWTAGGSAKVAASGLTMSGVFSSGNAAQWDPNNGVGGSISRQLSTSAGTALSSGLYYGSYLFNISGAISNASLTAIGTSALGANGTDNKASYIFAGKGYNLAGSASGFTPGLRTNTAAASQANAGGTYTALSTTSGQLPQLGTTYLMLFQVDPTTFTTNAWILSSDQLANFSSSLNLATLNAAAVGSASTSVFAKGSFTASAAPDVQAFLNMYQAGATGQTTLIDEIRFSNASLSEAVTAVPEPAEVAAALSALCVGAVMIKRRRIS